MNSLMPYPYSNGRLENLLQMGSFFAFVKDFETFFQNAPTIFRTFDNLIFY